MRCTARRLITGFAAIAAASLTVSLTPLAALPAQAASTRPSASAQLAAAQAAAVKQATQAGQGPGGPGRRPHPLGHHHRADADRAGGQQRADPAARPAHQRLQQRQPAG